MDDVAVVIVSTNEARWLRPCLRTVLEHMGDVQVDVVVADNESIDGTRELVESEFPWARVVTCKNKGFGHANNRALMTCDARYVLFLNPDTEIIDGTLEDLVRALDERPTIGLVGGRQLATDGQVFPTIRRRPTAVRGLCEALGSERLPFRAGWLGERELNMDLYDTELSCDWVSGSFMFARREAIESAGLMDERFFIYSEETDLCHRIRRAGWEIRHLPVMTILHHFEKAGISPRMEAQAAYARLQFARKNFAPPYRAAYVSTLYVRYLLRAALGGTDRARSRARRAASRRALRVLVGLEQPPFGPAPHVAVSSERPLAETAGPLA
jgi:N-acetylglucosaminyl-diphospho-decaprenol L-rhamnosyltransferase